MINIYSKNITVDEKESIPLSSVALLKGTTVINSGASSLQFNRCGIYELTADVTATALGDTGDIVIQLMKNNVLQPQAVAKTTPSDTTSKHSLSFTTLIQVQENNTRCPCSAPLVVELINEGVQIDIDTIAVTVTKIQ